MLKSPPSHCPYPLPEKYFRGSGKRTSFNQNRQKRTCYVSLWIKFIYKHTDTYTHTHTHTDTDTHTPTLTHTQNLSKGSGFKFTG